MKDAETNEKLMTLSFRIQGHVEAIAGLRAEVDGIHKALLKQIKRRDALIEEQDKLMLKGGAEGAWLLEVNDRGEQSKSRRAALDGLLASYGLRAEGYFCDTHQRALQVALPENDDAELEKIYAGLRALLPDVLPQKDGYKHIDVHEYELSGPRRVWLRAKGIGEAEVMYTTYGRESYAYKGTLRDCLLFIQTNHPKERNLVEGD